MANDIVTMPAPLHRQTPTLRDICSALVESGEIAQRDAEKVRRNLGAARVPAIPTRPLLNWWQPPDQPAGRRLLIWAADPLACAGWSGLLPYRPAQDRHAGHRAGDVYAFAQRHGILAVQTAPRMKSCCQHRTFQAGMGKQPPPGGTQGHSPGGRQSKDIRRYTVESINWQARSAKPVAASRQAVPEIRISNSCWTSAPARIGRQRPACSQNC